MFHIKAYFFFSDMSCFSVLLAPPALCHTGGGTGVGQLGQSPVSDRRLDAFKQKGEHSAGHGFPQVRQVRVT